VKVRINAPHQHNTVCCSILTLVCFAVCVCVLAQVKVRINAPNGARLAPLGKKEDSSSESGARFVL
jgi:hypothetical protein